MTLQEVINQDTRVVELRKAYTTLLSKKNFLIMEISHVEADIIKASGVYEAVVKDIVASLEKAGAEPDAVPSEDTAPEEVCEANADDGFATRDEQKDYPFEGGISEKTEEV